MQKYNKKLKELVNKSDISGFTDYSDLDKKDSNISNKTAVKNRA